MTAVFPSAEQAHAMQGLRDQVWQDLVGRWPADGLTLVSLTHVGALIACLQHPQLGPELLPVLNNCLAQTRFRVVELSS